jgi:hypothetical protein
MNFRTDDLTLSRIRTWTARLGLSLGLRARPCCRRFCAPRVRRARWPTALRNFATPEEACEALILAAERFDIPALKEILGPDGEDLVVTEDPVQDRNNAAAFAAQARVKTRVERDPRNPKVASLVVGAEDWPLPIPVIEDRGTWRFDSQAGRQEIRNRRIGTNELGAIQLCHEFVEAQHDYASERRDGALVNQYAQRMISTPGKQDGLAWRASDGAWQGPARDELAHAIADGYTDRREPYRGYLFKVLKGQGQDAPHGEMDFIIKGVMIGGFALVAAPADYEATGVKTFIVSHDGVVYEKDLGEGTQNALKTMERFDPDKTWKRVSE